LSDTAIVDDDADAATARIRCLPCRIGGAAVAGTTSASGICPCRTVMGVATPCRRTA